MKAPAYVVQPDRTPLPQGLYLIGCGAEAAAAPPPSAQAMGFKAWNLLRMAQRGLPVPPAFVLGTLYCADEAARASACRPDTWRPGLQALERATGLGFGDLRRPLLLSVRSGAPVSMPGMMDTLLNVGL
jgi:pyruvate, orthophosphate dikinase